MPLVSFVVPVYNYGRFLPDCLEAIKAQEGDHDHEVVVIDDCSTDNSREVIDSYADANYVVLENDTNRGHAATIERGLTAAQGKYIARVDPDDRHRHQFLAKTLEKFQEHPDVALVYGDAAMIDEKGHITAETVDSVHDGDFHGNELVGLLEENFICSPTVIARREAWLEALPIPEGLAFHDWYFTLMMARRHPFYFVDEVVADYRVHPSNHHARIVADKSEEKSVFRLLDDIFSEPETTSELETQKQEARRQIYGRQYLTLAQKYFGLDMTADARRCYVQAVRHNPKLGARSDVARQLFGTLIGKSAYGTLKSGINSVRSRKSDPSSRQ